MTSDFVDERRWHVYYCYAADGALLYVGMSDDPERRMEWHQYYSPAEWPWFCSRVEIGAPIASRNEARAQERGEISRLRPAFNKHHNPSPVVWPLPPLTERRAYNSRPDFAYLDSLQAVSA